jgi:hypothetical protein
VLSGSGEHENEQEPLIQAQSIFFLKRARQNKK